MQKEEQALMRHFMLKLKNDEVRNVRNYWQKIDLDGLRFYKYLKREHAELAMEEGKFRIGTTGYYQDLELEGDSRGDRGEGYTSSQVYIPYWTHGGGQELPEILKDNVKIAHIERSKFHVEDRSPPYFLYCFSEVCDASLMDHFQVDACIEIFADVPFFASLSLALEEVASYVALGPISYRERKRYDGKKELTKSIWIKDPVNEHSGIRHKDEREGRCIWKPKDIIEAPYLDVEAPHASAFCRMVKF